MNSIKKTARIAGVLYLLLALLGGFGILYIPSLVVSGDAAATANAVMASESMYRLSFVSGLLSQLVFIPLVLVLYQLLEPVNRNQALAMVVLALVSIPITMLNQLNQVAALLLLNGADYLAVFTAEQLQAQMLFFLELSDHGVFLVEIFWGLWLIPFGYLVFKSGYLPKILGILLIINGLGYVADFFIHFLFPDSAILLINYTGLGEPLIMLWLLIKGANVEAWEKRALTPEYAGA